MTPDQEKRVEEIREAEPRFWAKTHKTRSCWQWTGSTSWNGYGQFRVGGKRAWAHRYAYELLVGPILDGLFVDHLCRVRRCVNPAHMDLVTNGVNVLRGEGVTAVNATKRECLRGHRFTKANTRHRHNGWRVCLTCQREIDREWRRQWRLQNPEKVEQYNRKRTAAREALRPATPAHVEPLKVTVTCGCQLVYERSDKTGEWIAICKDHKGPTPGGKEEAEHQGMDEICSTCKEECQNGCECWCHGGTP